MSLSPPKPSRLFSNWDQVARRIRESRQVLLFLDFDGTLAPFASRPEQARLSGRARRILRRLARHPRVTLVVISGRRRADLLRHVGIRTIRYFGLYGWERTGRHRLPKPSQNALHRARQQLARPLPILLRRRPPRRPGFRGPAPGLCGPRRPAAPHARAVPRPRPG